MEGMAGTTILELATSAVTECFFRENSIKPRGRVQIHFHE